MIVEFYGIPGGGKTYQATKYKKNLSQKNVSYIDLSRHKGSPLWLKLLYKFADNGLFLIPKYYKLRKKLKKICRGVINNKPRYLPFSLDYCIGRIVGSRFIQDVFGNRKSQAVNDEGLFQWIVFLSVEYEIDVGQIVTALYPLNANCQNMCIQISVDDALANIRKRNRHVCPMDELSNTDLIDYLNDFSKRVEKLNRIICNA